MTFISSSEIHINTYIADFSLHSAQSEESFFTNVFSSTLNYDEVEELTVNFASKYFSMKLFYSWKNKHKEE